MKILSAQQIYKADKLTTERQQISSDMLMERAATGVFTWMHHRLQEKPIPIHLFCGIGNNGGDGLALARQLLEHNYRISVYVVNYSDKRSQDFLINLDRLKDRKLWPEYLDEQYAPPDIGVTDIVVDAIFGIGLNRAPDPWVRDLMAHINQSGAFVLSLDIPSGLFMDKTPLDTKGVIRANQVLSFQFPKLPFFLPETGVFLGRWDLLDIGLDETYTSQLETAYEWVEKEEMISLYRPRLKFSHKGNYGHAMIIGGSYGKIGAVALAAKACLGTGCGLATGFTPNCGYVPLQASLPELMVLTDENENCITKIRLPFTPKVIGIGMGMGTDARTLKGFEDFLRNNKCPLVIDADGLNILAKKPELLSLLPKGSVLTPHPGELERLIGSWENDFQKLEKAKKFSKEHHCILIIKGAHTITINGGKGFVNSTGNPGMATAGMGDVLAGMITALVAQGYTSLHASVLGVYLHGLAGDIAATKVGYEAVTASLLIDQIGPAFRHVLESGVVNEKEG